MSENTDEKNQVHIKDCAGSYIYATEIAGFNFPVEIAHPKISAAKNIFEIKFFTDKNNEVILRKSKKEESGDIAENDRIYPIKEKFLLYKFIPLTLKRDDEKIYVVNFEAHDFIYSINSLNGITKDEMKQIFKLILKADDILSKDNI